MSEIFEPQATTRDIVKAHMIDSLNRGLTLQAAINAALDAGLDEATVRAVGRNLKEDMIQLGKRRATKKIWAAVWWMLGSLPLAVIVVFFVHIPFAILAPPAIFVAGFIRFVMGAAERSNVEATIR